MSEGQSGGTTTSKLVVASIMVLLLMAILTWLQGRFDSSDHDKATDLVMSYRPKGGQSITEALLARHPKTTADQISWSSQITQSCLGHVRVSARVPVTGGDSAIYRFDVNLTGPSVHPTDETTVGILMSLSSTQAATRTTTATATP